MDAAARVSTSARRRDGIGVGGVLTGNGSGAEELDQWRALGVSSSLSEGPSREHVCGDGCAFVGGGVGVNAKVAERRSVGGGGTAGIYVSCVDVG